MRYFTATYFENEMSFSTTTAPGGLWLFGEIGLETVWSEPHEIDDACRLFPEATVQARTPIVELPIGK
jgi:hypothetical protein